MYKDRVMIHVIRVIIMVNYSALVYYENNFSFESECNIKALYVILQSFK